MTEKNEERRKFKRYSTEVKIYFDFAYELETKVTFKIEKGRDKNLTEKYPAVSQNISVEGLCFISNKKVDKGDLLALELYLPSSNDPIPMTGRVEWCEPLADSEGKSKNKKDFSIGVWLLFVGDDPVPESIYYDEEYEVDWSAVLESVFGNYKLLMGGKYKTDPE